ncbi:MAG: hypothetical protein M3348_00085, partial [Acidobacteriota bacterium]|nr:hypothetical protein [Acidobacteriota bacterium]
MDCTRCRKDIVGKAFDVTKGLRPSCFESPPSFDELDMLAPSRVFTYSCADCLTDDEAAKMLAPVAKFVIERLLDRRPNVETVQALIRVRAVLTCETGPMSEEGLS